MMASVRQSEWNERSLSEDPAIELLEDLGYRYLAPALVEDWREGSRSSILLQPLQAAIRKLNPWISDDNLNRATRAITRIPAVNLIEANQQAYYLLTRGTTVIQDLGSGAISQTVRFIDFDHPAQNDYSVTRQFRIQRTQPDFSEADEAEKRFIILDVVVFVNGLPLAVIECKSPFVHNPISDAIEQLRRYQELEENWQGRGAPLAFNTVQILIATCREQAVFGTIGTDARYYHPFPEPYPMNLARLTRFLTREPNPQDILIYSLLDPANLLEYTRNLVAFEVDRGRTIKKLARRPQRVAIDQAIQRIQEQTDPLLRGGVVWHTQGSGKSLTMIWLAQKLRQPSLQLENPTLVIVTDRIDLDTQISGTFQRVGFPNPQRAESAEHLQTLLRKGTGLTILTTLQKFYDASRLEANVGRGLNDSANIFVIVDEAHRSQYGSMAARMRAALPNATFLAFTGTPIDKRDRSTVRLFGDYIHKYTIEEAVRDKATVPIFYESRDVEKFWVANKSIDALFKRYFSDRSLEEQEQIRRRYATLETIAASPKRISEIAIDLIQHFEEFIHVNGFKGQIVAVNRHAAVQYQKAIRSLPNAPESRIIFTSSPNDEDELLEHQTTSAERKQLIDRFKDASDPLCLLIVVDMLLTGFDAPIEQVMYLDAPLKEHTLLQAIARVNRPCEGKEAGFIVDYWGVSEYLPQALRIFDVEELGEPMQPKSQELPVLERCHRAAMRYFSGIDRHDYEALLNVIAPEDERARFDQSYRAFARSLNLLLPDPAALPYEADFKWLSQIRAAARSRFRDFTLDDKDIARKVRQLIDQSIFASGIEQIVEPISIFDVGYDHHLETLPSNAARASDITYAIRYEINVRAAENPTFYGSLSDRLAQIIQDRREQRLSDSEELRRLLKLKQEAQTGSTRAAERLGLDETAYAFYGELEKLEIEESIAVELATEIESTLQTLVVVDWIIKDDVQREMRKRLRRLLLARGLTRNDAEPIIHQILDIARVKMAQ